jgi:VPDSG-CTERM motif
MAKKWMKPLFTFAAMFMLGIGGSARATSLDIVTYHYSFLSLSGDSASGTAPISQTDFIAGDGPHYGAGDRSNDPFVFQFHTAAGDVTYADYFGFGFTLSEDRDTLYANGSLAEFVFGGNLFVSFVTDGRGVTRWNGIYEFGGQTFTAAGTGRWLRDGQAVAVPDAGSSAVLLGLAWAGIHAIRRRGHPRKS